VADDHIAVVEHVDAIDAEWNEWSCVSSSFTYVVTTERTSHVRAMLVATYRAH
jgi:hypothetical protein